MAVIHRTTLTPTKLELLESWLPRQPWFRPRGVGGPALSKAGGFRLDDPAGEVGIEILLVTDGSDDASTTYAVPLSYRGSPLPEAAAALIGTAEHGVLGRRWVYDGAHDPVVVAQLLALMAGDVQAQQQSVSDTVDPSVTGTPVGADVDAGAGAGGRGPLALHLVRVLDPLPDTARPDVGTTDVGTGPDADLGSIEADVHLPGGTVRRVIAVLGL